jgi:hypothetical protein
MEPKVLFCKSCKTKTEHTQVSGGWECLCGTVCKSGCDHDSTITIVQRWYPGSWYEPPEVEERAYCDLCGEYGDSTDFPDAEVGKTVDAEDVRRREW